MKNFYDTREWKQLRYRVLKDNPRRCMLCGAENTQLHVDHIKPVSKFPELKLCYENLQILCSECNLGKSNVYFDDFRTVVATDLFRRSYRKKIKEEKLLYPLHKLEGRKVFVKNKKGAKMHIWLESRILCTEISKISLSLKSDAIIRGQPLKNEPVCLKCIKRSKQLVKNKEY